LDGSDADAAHETTGIGHDENMPRPEVPDMVRRMAAGISHDFNNILMVIKGYADLLANDPEVTDRTRDHLGIVLSATEQAAQLVSRLMAFSRQQVLDRTVCCLNVIVDSVLERHRELPINHVRLDVELDQSLPPLYGDPELIAEAISCIVINAFEAMPTGGTIRVRTALKQAPSPVDGQTGGAFLNVSIRDDGKGIAPAVLDRIFDPYFTTRRTGRGTGLGLAAANGIVLQHRGWIEVESESGRGSIFNIWLPTGESEELRMKTDERNK